MLCAEILAKLKATRVLNAFALALVFCGAELLLVPFGRVFEEHDAQAQQQRQGG